MPLKKTTTPMSDAAIKALIARSMVDALAKHESNRSRNEYDSHDSGRGRRRQVPTTRECTYSDFMKCQPLNFKVSHDAAYGMPWKTLMKMMTDKYCPRSEIKTLEIEIWNLKVKESDHVEKYVGGLPDMIQGSVMASKQKTMQDAIEIANDLMDQKVRGYAERCKLHHNGPCTVKCESCKMVGHMTRDCRNPPAAKNQRTFTCFKYGNQGHYRSDCSELKNQNHRNQVEGTEAREMVYALGGGEINQDIYDMDDDINA
nr:hypothetical protein [Tanacetum cinerariifolium]